MGTWSRLFSEQFARVKVLITGGAGFIGSHIAEALVELGATVIAYDDLSGGSESNLEFYTKNPEAHPGQLTFAQASVLDRSALDRLMVGCRYVFHQGALPSVPRSIEHPQMYHEVNVTGTLNVLESARAADVKRVMFAASSSAYGDSVTLPKIETMPPLPKSPYAANKLAGEHMMRAYAGSYDLDAVALRYFNIFGPRQNANSAYAGVIAAYAKCLAEGRSLRVDGDGEQSRDFTFVHNAVHANLLAATRPDRINGEVVNVGCGKRVTIKQLAERMASLWGAKDAKFEHAPDRPGDVKHSLADLTRARQILKYEPIVDFDTGLDQTVQWYQQQFSSVG